MVKIFKHIGLGFGWAYIILGCICAGCNREDPIVQKSRFVSLGGPAQIPYQEAVIEGCQYLFYDRGITHKGNCTNSIHIYNRQLENNK